MAGICLPRALYSSVAFFLIQQPLWREPRQEPNSNVINDSNVLDFFFEQKQQYVKSSKGNLVVFDFMTGRSSSYYSALSARTRSTRPKRMERADECCAASAFLDAFLIT